MSLLRTICVYCGSGPGNDEAFTVAARQFGRALAENGIGLVYGGGSVGLMGELATAVLDHGGHVTGVIPEFLTLRERLLHDSQEILVTRDMHERKRLMFEKSDAFVILPGGIGTLDETFEIVTWRQLHLHDKPVLLVNQEGYWEPFLRLIDHIIARDFASVGIRRLFDVVDDVDEVFEALDAASAPREQARAHRL
jgi:uncharacterized protein (TIGR00730 family)